jgi:hypothetical protein
MILNLWSANIIRPAIRRKYILPKFFPSQTSLFGFYFLLALIRVFLRIYLVTKHNDKGQTRHPSSWDAENIDEQTSQLQPIGPTSRNLRTPVCRIILEENSFDSQISVNFRKERE